MSHAQLRVGTSGWSYPSGRGAWNGVFYPVPPGTAARGRRGFDELAYYAEHFDTVEVNSTFYRVPTRDTTRSWAVRTPPGFEFSIKLFQKFTHPAGTGAPPRPPDRQRPEQRDVDEFRSAIDPLASAGKLGPLLVQFPPSFHADAESIAYLEWLLDAFGGHQLAVELRHRTWSDRLADTLGLLNAHRAAWVQIDEPKFRFSVRQNLLPNVEGFFYMRLHGRNAAQWWEHDAAEDRYNYLYTADELEPFAEAADVASRLVRKLYLYLNNHFEAKAVANAAQLLGRLGRPVPGAYPQTFLDRYPQLSGIVTPEPSLI
jgi:uncharacterized protein YecE (DUF72 family)